MGGDVRILGLETPPDLGLFGPPLLLSPNLHTYGYGHSTHRDAPRPKFLGHRNINTTYATYWDVQPQDLVHTMVIPWLTPSNTDDSKTTAAAAGADARENG